MANFIDGHVHLHGCFELESFLDAAYDNFAAAARDRGVTVPWQALLLLTETVRDNYFLQLRDNGSCGKSLSGGWQIKPTSEARALIADNTAGKSMIFIAGRQIVSAENLEILWLGTTQQVEDGLPIEQLISRIGESEGIAVIPWGPGKWFGQRGNIVQSIISQYDGHTIFLGDNGNRPAFWPTPTLFKMARQKGIRILPGSDPLPMATEAGRAGKFGFMVDEEISLAHPAKDLMAHIKGMNHIDANFGSLEKPVRFFRNQIYMQLIKKGLIKI